MEDPINLAECPAAPESPVVAIDAPDTHRSGYLLRRFGPRIALDAELQLYAWMDQLSPDYHGGFWRFVDLSNGGFYLAPDRQTPMRVCWPLNEFDAVLSADAAGIVATLFTLSHLCFERQGHLVQPFHLLREFAASHPECALILRAID